MVSLSDHEKIVGTADYEQLQVKDIATIGSILVAYDDEALSDVIQRLAIRSVHKLPVVARDDPQKIVGTIRRDDVVKAYNMALTRKNMEHFDEDQIQLRRIDHMELLSLEVTPHSRAAQQTLASLAAELPQDCLIVFIKRNSSVLIPHGDTMFYPGDEVNVFLHESDEEKLRKCLLGEDAGQMEPQP